MLYFVILLLLLLTNIPSFAPQCKTQTVFNSIICFFAEAIYVSQRAELCKNRPEATKQVSDSACAERVEVGGGKTNLFLLEGRKGWMPRAAAPKR